MTASDGVEARPAGPLAAVGSAPRHEWIDCRRRDPWDLAVPRAAAPLRLLVSADWRLRRDAWELALLRQGFRLVASRTTPEGVVLQLEEAPRRRRPLLSIVMPVYNEYATFRPALDAILEYRLDGLDREVIVVESNSTDGTRQLALAYAHHPAVTLILEDRPRGKGHAVRAGLARARGDLLLIHDADDEYFVDDYAGLLAPLLRFERMWVMGWRGVGQFKIRDFRDQPVAGAVFNLGHFLFVLLINLVFGAGLRDPMTMYKVMRRECLTGLRFECDRFDFDFELVTKLLRKGYRPLEIPVRYRARSLKQGKKVRWIRDPITWLRAIVKYRLIPIDA